MHGIRQYACVIYNAILNSLYAVPKSTTLHLVTQNMLAIFDFTKFPTFCYYIFIFGKDGRFLSGFCTVFSV